MRSPAQMTTLQIDITNACDKRCSNCTRFCGNHRKMYFMDFITFKRAVDSLEGYPGTTGLIGGEPTLHPEFERFTLYLHDKFGRRTAPNRMIAPQSEFIKEIHRREFESHVLSELDGDLRFDAYGPGLWSNMGSGYRRYYELINDVYAVQFLNDHINPVYHQPGLISRKDLGVPDDEWYELRDKCWVQNEWSATITPKGAFFCEVAGTLDMLFDGPGGWPIEKDWWKRTPDEFGEQLNWCELCGFALNTFMRDSAEEIDDVSQTLYNMLESVDSPRLKAGRTNLVKINNGVIAEESKSHGKHFSDAMPYIEHYEDRFNEANSVLFVHDFTELCIEDGEDFGGLLNIELAQSEDWIIMSKSGVAVPTDFRDTMQKYVINPGTLHLGEGFMLFSKNALALREYGFDRIARLSSFEELVRIWPTEKTIKVCDIGKKPFFKTNLKPNTRYAIWGTGLAGGAIADVISLIGAQLVCAVDISEDKHGSEFYGVLITPPETLLDTEFDYLICCNYTKYNAIMQSATRLGIDKNKIILVTEVQ